MNGAFQTTSGANNINTSYNIQQMTRKRMKTYLARYSF